MINRDKVMKGLECCSSDDLNCQKCPYAEQCMVGSRSAHLCADALGLLKMQQNKIQELERYFNAVAAALEGDETR